MFKLIVVLLGLFCFNAYGSIPLTVNRDLVSTGLQTFTYRVPTAGNYTIRFQATTPVNSDLAVSLGDGIIRPFSTGSMGQTQTALQFAKTVRSAAGALISIVMQSTVSRDAAPNAIKSIVSIVQGL